MNCYVMNFLCSRDIIHPLPCSLIITYILVPHLNVDKGVLVPINAINIDLSFLCIEWITCIFQINFVQYFQYFSVLCPKIFTCQLCPKTAVFPMKCPNWYQRPEMVLIFHKSPKFLFNSEKRKSAARMYSVVFFSYAPPQFWPLGSPKSQFCQKQLLLAALGLE